MPCGCALKPRSEVLALQQTKQALGNAPEGSPASKQITNSQQETWALCLAMLCELGLASPCMLL